MEFFPSTDPSYSSLFHEHTQNKTPKLGFNPDIKEANYVEQLVIGCIVVFGLIVMLVVCFFITDSAGRAIRESRAASARAGATARQRKARYAAAKLARVGVVVKGERTPLVRGPWSTPASSARMMV